MTRVVLIGANGQLGSDLRKEFPSPDHELVPVTRTDLDIRDHDRAGRVLSAIQPTVIVNTAAFHKVEACETDPELAFAVNATAVRNLALVAERLRACLVHMSTDYVFDGQATKPYPEDAPTNPVNVYGTSKLAGELFVRNLCRRHLVVRTSGLYGVARSSGKGGNFVETMLRLGRENGVVSVVSDQVLSPTYTVDLARMLWRLVGAGANGLYHVTSTGSCSWYEFARSIFDLSGLTVEVHPITTAASGSTVRRPAHSVLGNTRLEREHYGLLPGWIVGLKSYLDSAAAQSRSAPAQIGLANANS